MDGTLLPRNGTIPAEDIRTLRSLETAGVKRVIATGRSLYSARRVLDTGFPIDFLVFSSGAGIMEWKTGNLLSRSGLDRECVEGITDFLDRSGVNYMVHGPVPENHYFHYRRHRSESTDFDRRLELYKPFARPMGPGLETLIPEAAQVLVIIPPDEFLLESIRGTLEPQYHVIRATSPLDGHSIWLEIFPPGISKGSAIRFLCRRLKIAPGRTLALGNDYNDRDMLEMAGSAWVVPEAPQELKEKYGVVENQGSGVLAGLMRQQGLLNP